MALYRNLNIEVLGHDEETGEIIIKHNQMTFFKDNVMSLDVYIKNFQNAYNTPRDDAQATANVVFINGASKRYYDRSKDLPVNIIRRMNGDKEEVDIKFTVDILGDYTQSTGKLRMQVSIMDFDICLGTIPDTVFTIKPTLMEIEDDTTSPLIIESADVVNDVRPNGTYGPNDALGANQAAQIISQLNNLSNLLDTRTRVLNNEIDMLKNDLAGYKSDIDGISINLSNETTPLRIAEIKKILEDSNNTQTITDLSINIKDIMAQLENHQVYINNRVTTQEFTLYKDEQSLNNMTALQQINSVNASLESHAAENETNRSVDLAQISNNFTEIEADITDLKTVKETTTKLEKNMQSINGIIGQLINSGDEDVPTLKTYRVLKLKMYKNSQLAILSDTGSGNSIRMSDGLDVVVNFANPVDTMFITTVSPYSRLQFMLKSLDSKRAVIKCYNLEQVVEKVVDEVTGKEEDKVVMDIGAVNIHELPVGLEVHILYLA